MKRSISLSIATALAAMALSACATAGPVLVDIQYEAPEKLVAGKPKVVVGVSPFKDERGKKSSVVGARVTVSGDFENDLVVQGTVSELVTSGIVEALKARGITAKEAPAWDANPETLKAEGVDIVIGGAVKTFWVDSVTRPLNARTQANVTLRIVAADAKEKKQISTISSSGMYEREDLGFSPLNVGQALSAALSSTIEKLLSDEELKKKLK